MNVHHLPPKLSIILSQPNTKTCTTLGGSQQRTNQIQLNQGRESPTNVLYTANAKLDIFSPDSSQNKKRLKFDSINRGIAKKNKTQNSQQQQGRERNDSRLTEVLFPLLYYFCIQIEGMGLNTNKAFS